MRACKPTCVRAGARARVYTYEFMCVFCLFNIYFNLTQIKTFRWTNVHRLKAIFKRTNSRHTCMHNIFIQKYNHCVNSQLV